MSNTISVLQLKKNKFFDCIYSFSQIKDICMASKKDWLPDMNSQIF